MDNSFFHKLFMYAIYIIFKLKVALYTNTISILVFLVTSILRAPLGYTS